MLSAKAQGPIDNFGPLSLQLLLLLLLLLLQKSERLFLKKFLRIILQKT